MTTMVRMNAHALELYDGLQWHAHDEDILGLVYDPMARGMTRSYRDSGPVSPPSSPRDDTDMWQYISFTEYPYLFIGLAKLLKYFVAICVTVLLV
jgi:hypothetical protein